MPTGHFGIDQLEDTSTALKWAEQLGVKLIVCPWIAPEARGEDNATWTALGERLARLGETYRKAGYRFGWHNHDFEFKPTREGRLPMDILMETAPENDWEMDVAWVVRGGADPVAWLKKYGSRITAVHVKDIAPAGQAVDEGGWADAGHGTIDWNTLQREIKTHAKAQYWVMEHDNPSDFDRFARRSLESARQWR
jgi:sugar phosphate isomerase/epimerase